MFQFQLIDVRWVVRGGSKSLPFASCLFSSPSDQPDEHINTWVEHMKAREVGAERGRGGRGRGTRSGAQTLLLTWGSGAQSLLLT